MKTQNKINVIVALLIAGAGFACSTAPKTGSESTVATAEQTRKPAAVSPESAAKAVEVLSRAFGTEGHNATKSRQEAFIKALAAEGRTIEPLELEGAMRGKNSELAAELVGRMRKMGDKIAFGTRKRFEQAVKDTNAEAVVKTLADTDFEPARAENLFKDPADETARKDLEADWSTFTRVLDEMSPEKLRQWYADRHKDLAKFGEEGRQLSEAIVSKLVAIGRGEQGVELNGLCRFQMNPEAAKNFSLILDGVLKDVRSGAKSAEARAKSIFNNAGRVLGRNWRSICSLGKNVLESNSCPVFRKGLSNRAGCGQ